MTTYSYSAADGYAITLDDLATFVAEMKGYRELPGDTQVRFSAMIEFDLVNGPRANRVTADTGATRPNREQRRAQGQRGPRG